MLLCETAARANEALALDVEDLAACLGRESAALVRSA
jgi:hypothetical protein